MAVGALHHETPAQVLSCSRIVEIGKRVGHGRDSFTRHYLTTTGSLVLTRQTVGQTVQGWVQGPRHVGVCRLRTSQWGGRIRRQFADERGEEVSVASLSGFDHAVHVNVEMLLFEGAGEGALREFLHPAEHGEVDVITAVTTQHVHAQEDLTLCDLLTCGFTLLKTTTAT